MHCIKLKYHSSFRIFIIYFCCLLLLSGSILTYLHIGEIKRERDAYYSKLDTSCSQLMDVAKILVSSAMSIGNSIFSERWYNHFRNVAGIYNGEFTVLHRQEISTSINASVTALSYLSNILVITPSLDLVITKNGWYTINDYEMIYNDIDIVQEAGSTSVTLRNSALCSIVLEDSTVRREKSVVCVLINRKSLEAYLKPLVTSTMTSVVLTLNDQPLFSVDLEEEADNIKRESVSSVCGLALSITIKPYEEVLLNNRNMRYVLYLIIITAASCVIAFLFARITSKRLKKIVKGINPVLYDVNDPYQSISDYLETVSSSNRTLHDENATLHESIDSFLAGMKNEILLGMLLNPDFDFTYEYITTSIPWINDGLPYILTVIQPNIGEKLSTVNLSSFSEYALHVCFVNILKIDVCAIFWFNDVETARVQLPALTDALSERSDFNFAISSLMSEPDELYGCYATLRGQLEEMQHVKFYLPVALRLRFVNYIQSNKRDEIHNVLKDARNEYEPDAFLPLLLQIGIDYRIDLSEPARAYHDRKASVDDRWNRIISMASDLCLAISRSKHGNVEELADLVCRYVHDNFNDPQMCVNLLAERFSIHRTIISKLKKSHTGSTFGDYLTSLRMQNAFEYLKSSGESLYEIAEAIGYSSYTSFKRAFIRYQGISPHEYRSAWLNNSVKRETQDNVLL